ncbi:ras association domain-containing protein 10 [Anopheles nili]|uniref:ras association domain-containing protein 10 n=1 Tax=Anopheles nili TaxID=185578 RepID=UPI00237A6FC6|nr:ras association domain-containing protein 10 [Anopheles nili]
MNGGSGSGGSMAVAALPDHRTKAQRGAWITGASPKPGYRPSPLAHQKNQPEADSDEDDRGSVQSDGNESSTGETGSECSVDEIPVWIKGEQRWVSGVTDDTTCGDLIEVLVQQEQQPATGNGAPSDAKDYCITERWRQVEQVLDNGTKIWQIWTAWGKAQPEVKFILRRVDGSHGPMAGTSGGATGGPTATGERDRDSGRGSPTGSISSAIVRRKRHRAQKSTFAWMTHGQTIHPKSSKTSIERLMKLILEQGDIIQQQLSKLRDREMQITMIEEERHRVREREHGKNYLLETYLKGLAEAADTDPNAIDSGITSEATTTASPEMDFSPEADSDHGTGNGAGEDASVKEQIKLLERIVSLNKQIQREEESAVKLFEKVRRYQLDQDPPDQARMQLEEALAQVNTSIDQDTHELQLLDEGLRQSDAVLREKNELLRSLEEALTHEDAGPGDTQVIMDFSQPTPVLRMDGNGTALAHPSQMTYVPGNPIHQYPLYPIAEIPSTGAPGPVGPGEPAKIVIASNTLPRNFQRPTLTPVPSSMGHGTMTVPPEGISVHQLNKFIQCSNNLGTNCNTNIDDKVCPKQLFHSAVSSAECQDAMKTLTEDLANMGTLV